MNFRRAQVSVFTIIFIIIVFVIILAVALAPFISTTSGLAVETGQMSGIEAFLLDNLLLWIILMFIIWVLWATR